MASAGAMKERKGGRSVKKRWRNSRDEGGRLQPLLKVLE
jgi:hypothetical protein